MRGLKVHKRPVSKAAICLVIACPLCIASLLLMAQAYMVSRMMRGEPALDLLHLRDRVDSLTVIISKNDTYRSLRHEQPIDIPPGYGQVVRAPVFETLGWNWFVNYTAGSFALMFFAFLFGVTAVSERNRELGRRTAPWPPVAGIILLSLEIGLTSRMTSDIKEPRFLGREIPPYIIQNPGG